MLQLLRAAARAEIMPRFRKLDASAIRAKSNRLDLVTDADEAAETMIAQGLQRLHPGCSVVGEEASSRDPALLASLAGAEMAFVVDPIGRHVQLRRRPAAFRSHGRGPGAGRGSAAR